MRSIAIMNLKGGVGKTTTTVNVSAALAASGLRVCLLDLDPQAHASVHLGVEAASKSDSIYEVLVGRKELREVRHQVEENLWVVPAHLELALAEMHLAGVPGREMILRDKLIADDIKFDYVFIDCPPALGVLTLNALTAVGEVFIPLLPQYLPLQGLSAQIETIELVTKRLNNSLKLSGVIVCMHDGQTKLATEVVQDVDTFFRQERILFQTKIRRNIRLAEAPSHGMSIFRYDPNSNGAEDYRRLADEIIEQGEGRKTAGEKRAA